MGVPEGADRRALYLAKCGGHHRASRKVVVRFQRDRDAGTLGDGRAPIEAVGNVLNSGSLVISFRNPTAEDPDHGDAQILSKLHELVEDTLVLGSLFRVGHGESNRRAEADDLRTGAAKQAAQAIAIRAHERGRDDLAIKNAQLHALISVGSCRLGHLLQSPVRATQRAHSKLHVDNPFTKLLLPYASRNRRSRAPMTATRTTQIVASMRIAEGVPSAWASAPISKVPNGPTPIARVRIPIARPRIRSELFRRMMAA